MGCCTDSAQAQGVRNVNPININQAIKKIAVKYKQDMKQIEQTAQKVQTKRQFKFPVNIECQGLSAQIRYDAQKLSLKHNDKKGIRFKFISDLQKVPNKHIILFKDQKGKQLNFYVNQKGIFLYLKDIDTLLQRQYQKRLAKQDNKQQSSQQIMKNINDTHQLIINYYQQRIKNIWMAVSQAWNQQQPQSDHYLLQTKLNKQSYRKIAQNKFRISKQFLSGALQVIDCFNQLRIQGFQQSDKNISTIINKTFINIRKNAQYYYQLKYLCQVVRIIKQDDYDDYNNQMNQRIKQFNSLKKQAVTLLKKYNALRQ